MAANLKNIKSKIQSVKKTRQVTRAMEAVSAVKMRKAQERALLARPYARGALRILASVSGSIELVDHALTRERSAGKVAILLITSDKGLAGNLNSAVIKKVETFMREEGLGREDVAFVCLGRRGYEFARTRGYEVLHHEVNISDAVEETQVHHITDMLVGMQSSGAAREVRVAYTDFMSTFEQEAAMHKILPLSQKIIEEIVTSIRPETGKYAEVGAENGSGAATYTIEPNAEEVLWQLLPRLANIAIFHKLLESKASEHSARMVTMKNATDKAGEVAKELNLAFNKARQAAITAEVSEITSGIEAMR